MNKTKKAYDEIPYFSAAFSDCSPVRIEAVAKFLGLKAASLKEARVLELGSSYGGNILPFAISHKNVKVVGIDISSHQVAEGNKVARQIGLENFTLLERNFLHMNESDIKELGEFDYIIAHGVYSWVSPNVRDALLATIKALLSKDGIAYVSYNTYPGWKSLDILRDFMLFVSSGNDSKEALARVKSELNFLQDYLKFSLQSQSDVVYKDSMKLLLTQLNFLQSIIAKGNDYYILHDFLEASNEPTYFHKFAKHIDKHGLCYVIDASLNDIFASSTGIYRFDAHVEQNYNSRIKKEQLNDFLFNRSFRKSLIAHKERLGGAEDFDAVLGESELDRIYFSYFSEQPRTKTQEILSKSYPQSLNLSEVKAALGENANEAFVGLLEILNDQNTKISSSKLKALTYEPSKTKLKPRAAAYLKYFLNASSPVISLANELNGKLSLSHEEIKIALKFDGKASLKDIAKSVNLSKDELDKLTFKLSEAYFFEEI